MDLGSLSFQEFRCSFACRRFDTLRYRAAKKPLRNRCDGDAQFLSYPANGPLVSFENFMDLFPAELRLLGRCFRLSKAHVKRLC